MGTCVHLVMNGCREVRFQDGTPVPKQVETVYLGCTLSVKAQAETEVRDRISVCSAIWKRMGAFFKGSNCSKKFKIRVYDAVVRSKLAYGLESLQINECLKARIDAFHLKGLRQILKLEPTFRNREMTNEHVMAEVNKLFAEEGQDRQMPTVISMGEYISDQSIKLLGHLIRESDEEPTRQVTLKPVSCKPQLPRKKRVGRPRNHWTVKTAEKAWDKVKSIYNKQHSLYNVRSSRQDSILYLAALLREF